MKGEPEKSKENVSNEEEDSHHSIPQNDSNDRKPFSEKSLQPVTKPAIIALSDGGGSWPPELM